MKLSNNTSSDWLSEANTNTSRAKTTRAADLADAVVAGRVKHGRAVLRKAHAVDVICMGVDDQRRLLSLDVIDVHGVVAAASDDLPAVGRKLDGEEAKVARLRSAGNGLERV